jgi:hypothetical protein
MPLLSIVGALLRLVVCMVALVGAYVVCQFTNPMRIPLPLAILNVNMSKKMAGGKTYENHPPPITMKKYSPLVRQMYVNLNTKVKCFGKYF